MPKLIALVATAVMLNGQRTVILPGEAVPELPAHDRQALLAAGAIEDVDASLQTALDQAQTQDRALDDFNAARAAVQAAAQSTQADSSDTAAAAAAKSAARKAGK